jgi:serine/threonine-protein kinase
MARVFSAFDRTLRRRIAIKVLAPELAQSLSLERFRREIMVAASLQHPNIVPVLSAGEVGGLPYFIMPFVEGESLRGRLMRGPLSVRETINILRDIARALSLAHERGIVHRDIKPDNVFLTGGIATVTDFGVAKALAAARQPAGVVPPGPGPASAAITLEGTAVGTPAYMAPEQVAGDRSTDHRADLYALGIVGYEMLAGAPPFQGRSLQELLTAQLGATPTPVERRRAGVPAELGALIMQCLDKEAGRRPRSATAVLRILESPELASGGFTAPLARPRTRYRWSNRVARIVVGGALAASLTYAFWPAPGAPPAPGGDAPPTVLVPTFRSAAERAADPAQAAAITEQVVAGLAGMAGLRVAGPPVADSLAGRLRGDGAPDRPVTLVLSGLLQREAQHLRLTVSLVDHAGFALWGGSFDAQGADALRLQGDLAGAVLRALLPAVRAQLNLPEP